jgi:hypothetical protein
MANYLLAWEFGEGLGHAGRLKPLAQALEHRGHHCTLMLRDLVQTHAVLHDTPWPRLQAPLWLYRTQGLPEPAVSLAEILLGQGYLNPEHLAAQIQGWLAAFKLARTDVVVGDYAPTALLAAHIAGIASAAIGIGFYMPPPSQPMPAFRDWEPIAPGRVAHAEAHALASVNAVLKIHGKAPLPGLAPLYQGSQPLLCTWPELDHYGRVNLPSGQSWHGPNFFLSKSGLTPAWPKAFGPKVFAYLKSGHPDHVAVLQALVARGCATVCYLPEVAAGKPPPVQAACLRYAMQPVNLTQVCAAADLVVCHAGEATLVQALLAGVPVLLLPMQAEQFLMARCVDQLGAGINAAQRARPTRFEPLLSELLNQQHIRQQAQAFAHRHADFDHATQVETLVDIFESLLTR